MPRPSTCRVRSIMGLTCLAMLMAILVVSTSPAMAEHGKAELNENGIHVPSWFHESSLDLGRDLKAATAAGKKLAVFWEQKGCSYCQRMHEVNLSDEKTYAYINKNFYVIQLDMRGTRKVTDFDGTIMEEADMSHAHGVNGTPNIEFIDDKGERSFLMPGFAELPLFLNVFEYVAEGGYREASLRDWLMARAARQAG
ncbi:MAG: thioredoxin fold domain-containing protein [Rhodospirillaceae bacterium]|nr:thioredoxin fold domain-containing protein [Rhodospirillaceae bacterium]